MRQRTSFHPPASVYVGAVNKDFEGAILHCQANRFAKSSESTIKTAIKHWEPFAMEHGLASLVENGDPKRGGIAASFAICLARKKLAYGTIQGYIWGWEQHHINCGRHSPLDNVQDWARWMNSLEVQIFTPSEPTEMVPFLLLTRSLAKVDCAVFWMVRTACAMLMLFYTMSRSEYPVPKTHDGQHNFDPEQHCRQCDVRTVNGYVEWAFGRIKQDRLGKRLRGGKREWKPVGQATGIMSMAFWLALYLQMRPKNPDVESAFFVRADGKPLLYNDLLGDMRKLFCMVEGATQARVERLGLHGLRVLGYNAGRAAMGEDIAALQGGWFSDCHTTYGRETLNKILNMAGQMAKKAATEALPAMPLDSEPPISLGQGAPPRDDSVFTDESALLASTARPREEVPRSTPGGPARPTQAPGDEGITKVRRVAKARDYFTYSYGGKQYPSLKKAKEARSKAFLAQLSSMGYAVK